MVTYILHMFVSELEQFDPQNLFSLTFSSGDCWCIRFVLFVWCNAGIYIILHIRFFLPMEYTFSCYTFHYSKLVEILVQAFKVNSRRVNSLWSVLSNYGLVWKSLLDLKWFKWHLANVFLLRKRKMNYNAVYSFIPDNELKMLNV